MNRRGELNNKGGWFICMSDRNGLVERFDPVTTGLTVSCFVRCWMECCDADWQCRSAREREICIFITIEIDSLFFSGLTHTHVHTVKAKHVHLHTNSNIHHDMLLQPCVAKLWTEMMKTIPKQATGSYKTMSKRCDLIDPYLRETYLIHLCRHCSMDTQGRRFIVALWRRQ